MGNVYKIREYSGEECGYPQLRNFHTSSAHVPDSRLSVEFKQYFICVFSESGGHFAILLQQKDS